VHPDLVYDVGMHDGGDTAYYLSHGYRVVAIEADPRLVEQASRRFADEVQSGRLTILNVGITTSSGAAIFWISPDKSVWNSFDRRIAARRSHAHHPITVPTCNFSEILMQYGVPYYLKIDIEGNDALCIEGLTGFPLPPFISVETECLAEGEFLTEVGSRATLDLLHKRGYQRFKLIFQRDFSAVDSEAPEHRSKLEHSYRFRLGNSGPWGNQTPGRWLTYEEAKCEVALAANLQIESWHDWHATF